MKLADDLRQKIINSGKSLLELQKITGVDRSTLSTLKRGGNVSEAVLQKLNNKLRPAPRPICINIFETAKKVAADAAQPAPHNGKGTVWVVGSLKTDEWTEIIPKRTRKSTHSLILSPKGVLTIPRNLVAMYLLYPGQRASVFFNQAKQTIAIQRNPKGHFTFKPHLAGTSDTAVTLDLGALFREYKINYASAQRLVIQTDPTMLILELP